MGLEFLASHTANTQLKYQVVCLLLDPIWGWGQWHIKNVKLQNGMLIDLIRHISLNYL